jgi:glutathione peroxidase
MTTAATSIYDFVVTRIDGASVSLGDYRGSVVLVVNVASRCGYTPQYKGLEELYRRYASHGFVVLGFPCDQFGRQEPGTEADILAFCSLTYNVTFPMFSKVKVNGEGADPLFTFLKSERRGFLGLEGIKWNFTKFLIDRSGHVVNRFASTDTPEALDSDIQALLAR